MSRSSWNTRNRSEGVQKEFLFWQLPGILDWLIPFLNSNRDLIQTNSIQCNSSRWATDIALWLFCFNFFLLKPVGKQCRVHKFCILTLFCERCQVSICSECHVSESFSCGTLIRQLRGVLIRVYFFLIRCVCPCKFDYVSVDKNSSELAKLDTCCWLPSGKRCHCLWLFVSVG